MSYPDREPRRSVELDVQMKDFSFIKTSDEASVNMSLGGAFIRMDDPYPSGTLVKFQIRTPDNSVIEGVGKVAWLRKSENGDAAPSGVGIKFIKMSTEGKEQLEKVLEGASILVSEPPPERLSDDTLNLRVRSSVPPAAPPLGSVPPATDNEISPAAKVFEAIKAKASRPPASNTSTAPVAKTSNAPKVKTADVPTVKTSKTPKEKISDAPSKEKRTSRPSMGGQESTSKKTVTVSFPPKMDFVTKAAGRPSTPPAAPIEESVEATSEAVDSDTTDMRVPGRDSVPVSLTSSMQKDREDEVSSEQSTETAADTGAAERSRSPVRVIGIAAAVVAAIIALMFLGTGEPKPDREKESPAASVEKPAAEPAAPKAVEPALPTAAEPAAAVQESPSPEGAAAPAPQPDTPSAAPDDPNAPTGEAALTAPSPSPSEGEAQAEPKEKAEPAVETQTVELVTLPEGASITVNGKPVEGVTPLELELEKGKESTLTAHVMGYLTLTQAVTPSEETSSLELKLTPARIKFQMTSTPSGARILIDGKFNGATPYTFLRKKYKPDYQYKIEKKGYKSVEGTVADDQWVEEGRYYIFTLDAELTPAE